MQINPGSGAGIVDEIDVLCDTDTTSYPLASKVRRINSAYEELIGEIINSDGTWEWDDTNHTDLPVGTADLVNAQESYTFASEYLEIRQVKVKDASGNWQVLRPIDYRDFKDTAIEESFATTGMPQYYDIIGDTIKLYPAPATASVTTTAGLKIHFTRTADLFTTADTTQSPGLPSTHHVILAYMAAIPYCMTYKKDRVPLYQQKVQDMKRTLLLHYGRREKDVPKIMEMAPAYFR